MLPLRIQVAWWRVTDLWYRARATVRRATWRTTGHLKQKARRSRHKAKIFKEKAIRHSRHTFYSSFPGISRVKLPQPPVPHLLRSNNPPTEQETFLICDAISVARAETLRLEDGLNRKGHNRQRNLTAYKLERASTFVLEHKAILSPIRRIPPEILQEIFTHTLPSTSDGLNDRWCLVYHLPWALSQVSNIWRRTALGTSTLWSQLPGIDLDQEYTKQGPYLEFLNEILIRSHDVSIDVHLYGPTFADDAHPAIDLLIPHSHRWRRGRLEMPCASLAALKGIKGRLSSLQILLIQSWYESRTFVDSDVIINTFEDAPCLRNVALSGTYSAHFILPFHQLVDYSQEDTHMNQMDNVIDHSSASPLQNLSVFDFRQINLNRPPVILSQLVILKARFEFGTTHQNLLDFLVLPTLEELSISSCSGQLLASVSSMISRTGCPPILKKLFLRTLVADSGGELRTLLSKTCLLSHLNVSLPPAEDLLYLIPTGVNQIVAPWLQICEFYVDAPLHGDTIELLNRLASARCEPSDQSTDDLPFPRERRRLHTIYVHFDHNGISEPQQLCFQNWTATENAHSLNESRRLLMQYIPELYFGRRPARTILDFKKKDKVLFILACVENLNVERAEEVYYSGIHHTLKRLSFWFDQKSPKHKLSSKRILQKWDPIFESSLTDLRWAMKDGSSLMYLSKSSAVRSINDPTKIVFGVEDFDIPTLDLPWPLYGGI